MQGLDAVPGVAAAVKTGSRSDRSGNDLELDVVVVIRGGGARTDLAVFDHEDVARAIATCDQPVIIGVGHETDTSVADEVAHTSVKTPTAAAQVLIEAVALYDARLHHAAERIKALTHLHLGRANERLLTSAARLVNTTRRTIERQHSTLDQFAYRLGQAPGHRLQEAHTMLDIAALKLEANDPVRALRRGWTISYIEPAAVDHNTSTGDPPHPTLLRSPKQVTVGDNIRTVTAEGSVISTVTAPDTGPETEVDAS